MLNVKTRPRTIYTPDMRPMDVNVVILHDYIAIGIEVASNAAPLITLKVLVKST